MEKKFDLTMEDLYKLDTLIFNIYNQQNNIDLPRDNQEAILAY